MFSKSWLASMVGVALSVALPISQAHACACCAEPGERIDVVEPIDAYAIGVVGAVQFASSARLFTTAADWDEQVKGITNPDQSDLYTLNVSRTARTWSFALRDDKGHNGALTFRVPAKIQKFHADMQPLARTSGEYVPTGLYKEWRLHGRVTGTGMFAFKKAANARAELILHGAGNACTSSDQFTNWTLDVTGKGVQFRFFGALRKAN